MVKKFLELQEENRKLYDSQFKAIKKVQEDNQKLIKMQHVILQEVTRLKALVEQRNEKLSESIIQTKMNEIIAIPCTTIEAFTDLENCVNTDEDVKNFVVIILHIDKNEINYNTDHSIFRLTRSGRYFRLRILISSYNLACCLWQQINV